MATEKTINDITPDTAISDTDSFLKQSALWKTLRIPFSLEKSTLKTYFDWIYQERITQNIAPTRAFEKMDTGWTNWYGGATSWSHSGWTIFLPNRTDTTNVWMRKNITDMNLSQDFWFTFEVLCTNWTNITAVEILLWNASMTPNYWIFNILDFIPNTNLENNVYHKITISKEQFQVWTWVVDWGTTEDMIVRSRTTTGTTCDVRIKNWKVFHLWYNPVKSSWVVLFCADDGWSDQNNLIDIADKYGQKVCRFIIPSAVDTASYATQAEVEANIVAWHPIGMHGATPLTSLTWAALDAEIASIVAYRDSLLEDYPNYLGSRYFALPEGKTNTEVTTKLSAHFDYIFSIDEQKSTPYEELNFQRIPRRSLLNTTTVPTVEWLMDWSGFQIINFHHVITTPVISTDYSIADTDLIFAYANENNIVPSWGYLFP